MPRKTPVPLSANTVNRLLFVSILVLFVSLAFFNIQQQKDTGDFISQNPSAGEQLPSGQVGTSPLDVWQTFRLSAGAASQEPLVIARPLTSPITPESALSLSFDAPLPLTFFGDVEVQSSATAQAATGTVRRAWDGSTYVLDAQLISLPAVRNGITYEGWLVRSDGPTHGEPVGSFQFQEDGSHRLLFSTTKNLTDHTWLFITREPFDRSPAPADRLFYARF